MLSDWNGRSRKRICNAVPITHNVKYIVEKVRTVLPVPVPVINKNKKKPYRKKHDKQ